MLQARILTGAGALSLLTIAQPFSEAAHEGQALAASSEKTEHNALEPTPVPVSDQVQATAKEFDYSFAQRVRRRDYFSAWSSCFSTGSGKSELPYNQSKVRFLRTSFQQVVDYSNRPIVVLDRGHGHETRKGELGYDPGSSREGLLETDVIDAVSAPLKNFLEKKIGAIIVETRQPINEGLTLRIKNSQFGNQKSALQKRAELTSSLTQAFPYHPVLFISLHANVNEVHSSRRGGEIYYYNQIASSENSRLLAQRLAQHYSIGGKESALKSDDFAVLRCQYKDTPAVLVELGYLTNDSDRAILRRAVNKESHAENLAQGIAKGVAAYLNQRQIETRPQTQLALKQA